MQHKLKTLLCVLLSAAVLHTAASPAASLTLAADTAVPAQVTADADEEPAQTDDTAAGTTETTAASDETAADESSDTTALLTFTEDSQQDSATTTTSALTTTTAKKASSATTTTTTKKASSATTTTTTKKASSATTTTTTKKASSATTTTTTKKASSATTTTTTKKASSATTTTTTKKASSATTTTTTKKTSSATTTTTTKKASSATTTTTTKKTSSATTTITKKATSATSAVLTTISYTTDTTSTTQRSTTSTSATTTSSTTTTTTTTLPAPVLEAVFDEGFPTGDTVMHIMLRNNTGLNAVSFAVALPEILSADPQENQTADFQPSDAFSGQNFFSYYNEDASRLAIGYSNVEAGAPNEELGSIRLHISEEAKFGAKYPVQLILSSLVLDDGRSYSGIETQTDFIPAESPLRSLSEKSLNFKELGVQSTLTLSPEPPEGSCVWESSDPEVASVSNGVVSALKEGVATITVVCQKRIYSCNVTVKFDRSLTPVSMENVNQGDTVQLALTPAPAEPIRWSSSDPAVLSIDENGIATAHRNGTVTVQAVSGTLEYAFTFPVTIPRKLNATSYLFTHREQSFKLTLSPAPEEAPVFRSSNSQIVSVSEDGTVTPLQNGTAVIICVSEEASYPCEITVQFPYQINFTDYAAKKQGDGISLGLLPKDDHTPVPIWGSSDPEVASVDENGQVTLLKEGEAVITAVADGYTYSCHVSLLPYLLGDVNENGVVSVEDAQLTLLYYVEQLIGKTGGLTAHQQLAANVYDESKIDLTDACIILNYATNILAGNTPKWENVIAAYLS